MSVDPDASVPRQGSRALTALLPLGCIAVVFVGLRFLLASADVPDYVRGPSGREPGSLAVAMLSVLLLWIGFAPAWLGNAILRKPKWSLGLPVWAVVLGGTFLVMFRVSTVGLSWGEPWNEQTLRLVLLFSYVALIFIVSSAVVGAARLLTWDSASKCVLSLLLMGLPWILLAHIVLVSQGTDEGGAGLVRAEPFGGHVFLVLLLFLVAMNGAAVGFALRRPRIGFLLGSLVATGLLVAPGWLLLRLGLVPEIVDGGATFPAVRLLLAAHSHVPPSSGHLFFRWFLVQVGLVLVLAVGQLCALRLVWRAPAEGAGEGAPAPAEEEFTPAAAGGGKPKTRPGRAYLILTFVYGLLVVYGSLVPLEFQSRPFEEALEMFLRTPYLILQIGNRADFVANLLLFIPLTFLAMGALTRENTRGGQWLLALLVMAGGAALSAGIEFTQLFFPPRTVSLNDILAECAGAAVGIVAWLALGGRITVWWRGLVHRRGPREVAAQVLTGYVVALMLYQLFPYDLVVSADEMMAELRQGKLVLAPFADLPRASILVFLGKAAVLIPVGYWVVVRWARGRRPVLRALAFGAGLTLALELLQLLVYSRYSSSTDVILGTWGAGMGGALATRFGPAATRPLPRGPLWRCFSWGLRLTATVAVASALIWGKWGPFAFRWPEEGLSAALLGALRVPFYYQYWNTEFEAAAQLLRDAVVPAVLGLLLMSLASRVPGGGRLVVGVVAGAVSAAVELGQVFFPPHVADMTTALLAVGSGICGAFLYRLFVESFVRPARAAESEQDAWQST